MCIYINGKVSMDTVSVTRSLKSIWPMAGIQPWRATPWQHDRDRHRLSLIMGYFAFSCRGWPRVSIWSSKGHGSYQEISELLHCCELYWLRLKIKRELILVGLIFISSNNIWSIHLMSQLVFTENNHKLPWSSIVKWIDRCIHINNRLWKCLPHWKVDMSESIFDDTARILGCRHHGLNNT